MCSRTFISKTISFCRASRRSFAARFTSPENDALLMLHILVSDLVSTTCDRASVRGARTTDSLATADAGAGSAAHQRSLSSRVHRRIVLLSLCPSGSSYRTNSALACAPLHPALPFVETSMYGMVPLFRRAPDPTIQWVPRGDTIGLGRVACRTMEPGSII